MEQKEFRIGLVGLGRISRRHIEAIANVSPRARLVAVCDSDPSALQEFNESADITKYQSLDTMLECEKLDIVSVCTPSGLHPDHGVLAARSGANVIVEKPIGVNVESAEKLIEACLESRVKLFVVKQNRFNPSLRLLRGALESRRFGRVFVLVANVFWTRPQAYYDQAPWRGTWQFDGGAFLNQASHYVDLMQWIGGPIRSVQGKTKTLARKIEAEDTGAAILEFESGAIATLNVTMLTHGKNLEGSITILGENGTAKIGGVALNRVEYWQFSDGQTDTSELDRVNEEVDSVYGRGHAWFYAAVLDALEGKPSEATDGEEGIKTVKIIESIYRSSREERSIKF